jgi:hypothetical protein
LRGLAERVVEIHRALDQAGIAHAFGGAIAYAYHGEPRATRDIDVNLFVPSTAPMPALDALAGIGVTLDRDAAAELVRRDGQVRLLSAEDLAVCKVAFDREQDWVDLREMLGIRGDAFDAQYVADWLDSLVGADDPRTTRFRNLWRERERDA